MECVSAPPLCSPGSTRLPPSQGNVRSAFRRCQRVSTRPLRLEEELLVLRFEEEGELVPQVVVYRRGRGPRPRWRTRPRGPGHHSRSRRSDASLRSLRPFWAVFMIVPSPRRSRSTSASSEPVGGRDQRLDRAATVAVAASSPASTSRPEPPRPTRPRSWWSWAIPKRSASRMTMTVAFGNVDADLDHRRGHEHVERRRPGTGPSPPPSRPTASGRGAARGADRRARPRDSRSKVSSADAASSLSDSSMSGHTTYAWWPAATSERTSAHTVVLLQAGRWPRCVVIGVRPGGISSMLAHVEVAVDGHRRGPGDRRRGHDQHVGHAPRSVLALGPQRRRAARRRSGAARRSPPRRGRRTAPPSSMQRVRCR